MQGLRSKQPVKNDKLMCPLQENYSQSAYRAPILPPGLSVIGQLQAIWKPALPCYLAASPVDVYS